MAEVLIIGAGIAGITAARTIYSERPDWQITLVDDEDRLPYKRTKISKNISRGFDLDEFALFPREWYAERGIRLITETRAASVDAAGKSVSFENSKSLNWDRLILATGAAARVPDISGYDPERCFTIRRASDVDSLLEKIAGAESILVVGLGVLGVEVSEQLVRAGFSVSAASSGESVMPRELNARSQEIMTDLLRRNGVNLFLGYRISSLVRNEDMLVAETVKGDLRANHIVFAVGSEPLTGLAVSAGAETDIGIAVNPYLETSVKDIYAAGDAVQLPSGKITHLWHEAEAQGRCAGLNVCGGGEKYPDFSFRLKCE
ncbi:MAG: NAD(P)/FAD-dependent oxidoreductase, partial [Spirochaetales bacterium]|nr:NAD(P)/FAD-dependent oxidoreductase [Spirochaetales bacterium]